MSISFKGVAAKIVAAAKDFKAEILKAAEKAPAIAAEVEKDAPEVAALVELAFPGFAAIEPAAIATFEVICDAVEGAGPAAAQNGLSVSLDKTLIADIQQILPQLKALAAKL
jgi:hypothetical protein